MDVAGDFLQIIVRIDQEGMVAALVKMTRAVVTPVEVGRIGDVEVPHEFLEIAPGGLHQQVKVVVHQNVGKDLRLIDVSGAFQQIEKSQTVGIGEKDILSVIAATGNMVIGILELNPKWPCHVLTCITLRCFIKNKDLTPIFLLQGEPILTIKELLGHKRKEMTLRYAHPMPDQKKEAVGRRASGSGACAD
jgi:hypothetical protein